MLKIHIPSPVEGRAHPFYSTDDDGCLDLVDLSFVSPRQTEFELEVRLEYEDQPVLIVTAAGSYLVQANPVRLNEAPLVAVESSILGVYPLYRMVHYRRAFDKEILNKLRQLIDKKESILELDV